jgi:Gpi18-like mannosyltransferase
MTIEQKKIAFGLAALLLLGLVEWFLRWRRAQPNPHRYDDQVLLAGGLALAVALRVVLRAYEAPDYGFCLLPWYQKIATQGLGSLDYAFCNYPPLYLYLVALGTYLPVPPLYWYKLISYAADFGCAYLAYRSVRLVATRRRAIAAALGVLVCPTVLYNSGYLAQADMTYTVFLVLAAYLMARQAYFWAMLAVGVAFCFKLQAVFFVIPLLALWVRGKVSALHLLAVPGAYLLSTIPNGLLGRSWLDLFTIYANQTTHFPSLSLNAPSVFALMEGHLYSPIAYVGIFMAMGLVFFMGYLVMARPVELSPPVIMSLALISTLGVPYLLPSMHERYFFAADVFAVLYAFCYPRRFWVPLVMVFCSFMSYNAYLVYGKTVSLAHLAIVLGGLLVYLVAQFVRELPTPAGALPRMQARPPR